MRVAAFAYDSKRATEMVSTTAGLVVARTLGCEREKPLTSLTHVCGAASLAALRPVLPGLRAMLEFALTYPDEDGIACSAEEPIRCTVAPHSECHPLYELYFSDGSVVAVVERDDWQSNDEARRAFDERVAALMQTATCPPPP